MTRIALDASADLPAWTPAAVRPGPFGLLVWDGGLPHLPWPGAPETAWTTNAFGARTPPTVAVDGVWWGPDPVGIRLHLLTRTDRISQWLTQRWAGPDLFAFGDIELSLHDPVPEAPSSDFSSGLVAALGTTWLLMAQPTVVSRIPMREPQTGRGAYRAPTKEPVTLVDLRRLALPPRDPDGEPSGRAYRHRWMVRGHWRQQACGAGRAQRRPTWVPPHVKGPQGAPLLETEHVMVWRR